MPTRKCRFEDSTSRGSRTRCRIQQMHIFASRQTWSLAIMQSRAFDALVQIFPGVELP